MYIYIYICIYCVYLCRTKHHWADCATPLSINSVRSKDPSCLFSSWSIHTPTVNSRNEAIWKCEATLTLHLQVRNAEDAGAIATIVYDNIYEALIIMAKPLGNPDPSIPAVFVSQKAGIVMQRMALAGDTYAEILPVPSQTLSLNTKSNFD